MGTSIFRKAVSNKMSNITITSPALSTTTLPTTTTKTTVETTTTDSLTFSVTGTTKFLTTISSGIAKQTQVYETFTVSYPRPIAVAGASKMGTFMILLFALLV